MNTTCPHCGQEIRIQITRVQSKSSRAQYYRMRYLASGRAKVFLEPTHKCIDCGGEVEGRRWRCETCKVTNRRKREKGYTHKPKVKNERQEIISV